MCRRLCKILPNVRKIFYDITLKSCHIKTALFFNLSIKVLVRKKLSAIELKPINTIPETGIDLAL